MNTPILSIITVNLNNKAGLLKTIQSIKSQTFSSYEHIIIDAGSTDGSKEVILDYQNTTSHLAYWVSEPDKGIYDGMNKGLQQAHGEYIYFLNSGDVLSNPSVLASIPFDGINYICGNMEIIHPEARQEIITPPEGIDGVFLLNDYLPHPASFIHHSLFKGQQYNTDYKVISDWIHMVENIMLKGCSYKHVDVLVSNFDITGISSSNRTLGLTERKQWLLENLSAPIYNSLIELEQLKHSEVGSVIPITLQKTSHTQRRMKKMVLLLAKVLK